MTPPANRALKPRAAAGEGRDNLNVPEPGMKATEQGGQRGTPESR